VRYDSARPSLGPLVRGGPPSRSASRYWSYIMQRLGALPQGLRTYVGLLLCNNHANTSGKRYSRLQMGGACRAAISQPRPQKILVPGPMSRVQELDTAPTDIQGLLSSLHTAHPDTMRVCDDLDIDSYMLLSCIKAHTDFSPEEQRCLYGSGEPVGFTYADLRSIANGRWPSWVRTPVSI